MAPSGVCDRRQFPPSESAFPASIRPPAWRNDVTQSKPLTGINRDKKIKIKCAAAICIFQALQTDRASSCCSINPQLLNTIEHKIFTRLSETVPCQKSNPVKANQTVFPRFPSWIQRSVFDVGRSCFSFFRPPVKPSPSQSNQKLAVGHSRSFLGARLYRSPRSAAASPPSPLLPPATHSALRTGLSRLFPPFPAYLKKIFFRVMRLTRKGPWTPLKNPLLNSPGHNNLPPCCNPF
jgi:hypothetical protein